MSKETDICQEADMSEVLKVLSQRIGAALWQAEHTVGLAVDQHLSQEGLGLSQVTAMMHLREQPKLSGAALSRLMLITRQSATTLLGQLEAQGWISRTEHHIHRGILEATLSVEGEEKLNRANEILDEFDARLGGEMNLKEREQLFTSLSTCLRAARTMLAANAESKRK